MEKTKFELIDTLKYCADSIKTYGDTEGYLDDHHMKLILLKVNEVAYYYSKELNRREITKKIEIFFFTSRLKRNIVYIFI